LGGSELGGAKPPKLSRGPLKNLGYTILICFIAMVCLPLIYSAPQAKS